MSESVAQRLEAVRSSFGWSQQQFATQLGVAISTYQRYASGERGTIKTEQLEILASFGVDLTWLLTGKGEPSLADRGLSSGRRTVRIGPANLVIRDPGNRRAAAPLEPPDGFVLVPRYDLEASAGGGALAGEENILDYMAFQETWVRRALRVDPARLALISATGDSMEPSIRPGDLLLVDCSIETVMDDSIYLVSLNDFLLVKRVQKLFRGVTVSSDNPHYAPITLDAAEASELRIRGRVRWVGRLI